MLVHTAHFVNKESITRSFFDILLTVHLKIFILILNNLMR